MLLDDYHKNLPDYYPYMYLDGYTPEQKILAQRIASGLMDYYSEIGQKWQPK